MTVLPAWFVVLMGIGTVFVGLFLIILLCSAISFFFLEKIPKAAPASESKKSEGPIQNRGEVMAAICAAIAEEEGTDIQGIKVLSIKKC